MLRGVVMVAAAAVAMVPSTASPKPGRGAVRRSSPPATASVTQPAPEVAAADAAPGGMMTPKEVTLRPTTPAETEANAVWSTRAALNIAALQCQFSPFLATVRNYNDFLRQHADELDRARTTMLSHFKRYDATQAQNSFDHYTTQTYNSYSTLDAQYAFCDAAGSAGRSTLTLRKGELGRHAAVLRDRLRASLIPTLPWAVIRVADISATLPPL